MHMHVCFPYCAQNTLLNIYISNKETNATHESIRFVDNKKKQTPTDEWSIMVTWIWPELADTKDQIRTSAFKLSGAEVFEEPKVLLLYFVRCEVRVHKSSTVS